MAWRREAHELEVKQLQALDLAEMEAAHPWNCQCESCLETERILDEFLAENE